MNIINCCPHPITFRNKEGQDHVFPKSEHQARVLETATPSEIDREFPVYVGTFGEIDGLPEPQPGTMFIVSGLVLSALRDQGSTRTDVISPGTGPGDKTIRDEKGQILAVTRFKGLI